MGENGVYNKSKCGGTKQLVPCSYTEGDFNCSRYETRGVNCDENEDAASHADSDNNNVVSIFTCGGLKDMYKEQCNCSGTTLQTNLKVPLIPNRTDATADDVLHTCGDVKTMYKPEFGCCGADREKELPDEYVAAVDVHGTDGNNGDNEEPHECLRTCSRDPADCAEFWAQAGEGGCASGCPFDVKLEDYKLYCNSTTTPTYAQAGFIKKNGCDYSCRHPPVGCDDFWIMLIDNTGTPNGGCASTCSWDVLYRAYYAHCVTGVQFIGQNPLGIQNST